MPSVTETVIREQFPFWEEALRQEMPEARARTIVLTGCGTSFYLAQSLACAFNAEGRSAIAVPGAEWARRPGCYLADAEGALVIGLSRSGATTETIEAIATSRERGLATLAVSCERGSAILEAAARGLLLPTHPAEGIVMSVSASVMLLAGLRMAGVALPLTVARAAASGLAQVDRGAEAVLRGRSHFVYLGGGVGYGIACEGALKLQEMSISYSQAFHPMEYRHGPISLVDERSVAVVLYSQGTMAEEARLAADLQAKGARVIGVGGPGDLSIDLGLDGPAAALAALPALQMLGEVVARMKGVSSETPRHLSKVVVLT